MLNFISAGQLLLVPLLVMFITQAIKVLIDIAKQPKREVWWHYFTSYGGMPSSHSALFISLVTMAYLDFGWQSFEFAVSVILYLTVVRDAVGIRWHLGEHGKILKQIIAEEYKDHQVQIKHDHIVTRLGHTPLQAFIGTLCGIALTLLLKIFV